MRALSNTMLGAIHAPESGEVLLPLLRLSHPDWAAPLRIVPNGESVTHEGEVYLPWAFAVALPDDEDQGYPILRWQADGVQRDIIAQLRATTGVITARLVWVLASQPDTIEAGPITAQIRAAEYDATSIGGTMQGSPIYDRPFSRLTYTPNEVPQLF